MSTAPRNDSDSEDDDYVPSIESASESSGDELEVEDNKQAQLTGEDEAAEKHARDALWSSFQASVSTPEPSHPAPQPKQMIKVVKRYLFAGEEVVEVAEVAQDSNDARKWPAWQGPESTEAPTTEGPMETSAMTPGSWTSSASQSVPPPKHGKRPGPRKSKTLLAALPTSSSGKVKKLSTLDKSAMDWRAHLQTGEEGLKDELEANRRSGGYLEKVEFLKRVDERKEETLEASRSSKRRRL